MKTVIDVKNIEITTAQQAIHGISLGFHSGTSLSEIMVLQPSGHDIVTLGKIFFSSHINSNSVSLGALICTFPI